MTAFFESPKKVNSKAKQELIDRIIALIEGLKGLVEAKQKHRPHCSFEWRKKWSKKNGVTPPENKHLLERHKTGMVSKKIRRCLELS